MNASVCTLDTICMPSADIVVREIEGELVIVALTEGISDLDDGIYTLNQTGKAMWNRLDGKKNLAKVAAELAAEFKAAPGEVEQDVLGLAAELLRRKILAEVSSGGI
ncbi:MAG: PqqD family protein [Terriglobia bacterium]